MEFQNKNILVIGAGISGFAAAKIAKKFGANVTLSDAKNESDLKYNFDELREVGINLKFGAQTDELLNGVDLIIVSPAVPLRIPILQTALQKNISVISEVELAYNLAQSPIFAITGTNGKTTTTTLLGLLLETWHFLKLHWKRARAVALQLKFQVIKWRRQIILNRTFRQF